MNEKIAEKLKDPDFFKELIVIPDKEKVKEAFKKHNIEVTEKDLEEIKNLIKTSLNAVLKLSDEDLEQASGGYLDGGVVYKISGRIAKAFHNKDATKYGPDIGNDDSWISRNSDKITEGALATLLVGGTLGVEKLIKTGIERGWWTKDYWSEKKNNLVEKY